MFYEKDNSEFKLIELCLKNWLNSYPVHEEELVNIYKNTQIYSSTHTHTPPTHTQIYSHTPAYTLWYTNSCTHIYTNTKQYN